MPTHPSVSLLHIPYPSSVDFFHCRTASATTRGRTTSETATQHATLWHITSTTCRLVYLHHDRVHDTLNLLLLCLKLVLLRKLVLVKPIERVLHRLFDLLLVTRLELILELL